MNVQAVTGWGLAVLAVALGYTMYGWPGVVLGVTMVVFWMLLQFTRTLRVMREAGAAPIGQVPSAVMLHAKLAAGLRLLDILKLTRSLGRKTADDPETFVWADDSGASVTVELVGGRCTRWTLQRPQSTSPAEAGLGVTGDAPSAQA